MISSGASLSLARLVSGGDPSVRSFFWLLVRTIATMFGIYIYMQMWCTGTYYYSSECTAKEACADVHTPKDDASIWMNPNSFEWPFAPWSNDHRTCSSVQIFAKYFAL